MPYAICRATQLLIVDEGHSITEATNIPFDLFAIGRHIYDLDREIGRLDEIRGDSFKPWNEHDTVHFYCHVTTV
jgi:hypothetical protein